MLIHLLLSLSTRALFSGPARTVEAYLDPGSGSFILQILLASIVGGLFVLRTYRKKISAFLRRLVKREEQGDENEDIAGRQG